MAELMEILSKFDRIATDVASCKLLQIQLESTYEQSYRGLKELIKVGKQLDRGKSMDSRVGENRELYSPTEGPTGLPS